MSVAQLSTTGRHLLIIASRVSFSPPVSFLLTTSSKLAGRRALSTSTNIRSTVSRVSTRNTITRLPFSAFHSTPAAKMVKELSSKEGWDAAIKSDKLVVLDCYADWCGPCRLIAPKIVAFSQDYPDVDFYKLNVDEVADVASELGVRAMPTFYFFKGGEKIAEVVGANPAALKSAIEKHK